MASIDGKKLTTYEVSPDGSSFQLNFNDAQGRATAIRLPAEALHVLVLTMPQIANKAIQAKYRDRSIRLVYPVADWSIDAALDDDRRILTLRTRDGFEVSFSATGEDLVDLFRAATESCVQKPPPRAN
jgi:hypothetical protein